MKIPASRRWPLIVTPLLLIALCAGLVEARLRPEPSPTAGWERPLVDAGGGYGVALPPGWHGATVNQACGNFYCALLVISNAAVHADALFSNVILPPGSVAIAVGAGMNVHAGRGVPTCAATGSLPEQDLAVDGVGGEEYRGSLLSDFPGAESVVGVCLQDPLAPLNYYGLKASFRGPHLGTRSALFERMLGTIRFNHPAPKPWWRRGLDWLADAFSARR